MEKISKILSSRWYLMVFVAFAGSIAIQSCDNSTGGKLGPLPKASFTATPLSGNPNKVVVQSTSNDAFMWKWDFGNGTSSSMKVDTTTYIYKGNYTITLTVFGHGGKDSTSKQVQIAQDYQGQNVLMDNGALKSSDWTYLTIPGGGNINVTYTNNTAVFTDNSYSYGAIYQPVQVEAGVKYLFSAMVQGSGMGSQSWFEIYLGTSQPTQGSDYTDNKYVSLNTYVPCGESSFDGDLANIGCSGNGTGKGGIITFSNSGTVYLVIKAGSNGGTLGQGGVTLKSISLVKLQ